MRIRAYRPSDCRALAGLFYDTVHAVNARDYTEAQLNAWASGDVDLEKWNRSFLAHDSFVAEDGTGMPVGFGDIDRAGYLDRLFVRKDCQRQGIGTALCGRLEQAAGGKVSVHASVTAKPFFEQRGYRAVRMQYAERDGIFLPQYVMEKGEAGSGLDGAAGKARP